METEHVPAITNSVVVTLAGELLHSAQEWQHEKMLTQSGNIKHVAQFADGTTFVIVQQNDDLRQICLRHLGRYDAEVLHEIREFNPELTDPDRITVGQQIILSTPATVRSNASRIIYGTQTMSKNFELLTNVEGDRGLFQATEKTVEPSVSTSVPSPLGDVAREEVAKLVQRVFLTSREDGKPRAVAFCGLGTAMARVGYAHKLRLPSPHREQLLCAQ